MNKVTIFKKVLDPNSPQYTDVVNVLNLIKTGGTLKDEIVRIRTLSGNDYKEAKMKLPVICFGGVFTTRSKEGISEGSGLLVLDFDEGTVEQLTKVRCDLNKEDFTLSTFMSPKSEGRFKALIRIPITTSDEEYKKYFAALQKQYKTVDKSGKDISRAAFFSYDENIYINENATIWDKKYETPQQKKTAPAYNVRSGAWDNINTALRKIEDSRDGEKHDVRTKISYLFGGWVSAKDLEYSDAQKLLENAALKNTTDERSALKDIKDGLQAGMSKPLRMNEQRNVLNMEVGLGRKYYPMREVMSDVKAFHKNGYQRGWEIGFDCANPAISILTKSTSYWYGKPADGKSQIWNEIQVNIIKEGLENGEDIYAAILSPETGDIAQVYGELVSIWGGQTFIGESKMSEEDMNKYANLVAKHFIVIDFEGEDATIRDFHNQVEAIEREFGIHVSITTIDPLNYLTVNEGKYSRRDIAIGKDLDFSLADARKNNRHNALITHSSNQQIQKNNDGQWFYPIVSPRGILDGEQYFRKGMLMVSVYRPLDITGESLPNDDGTPYAKNEVHLMVQKAKPKGSSEVSKVVLFYDRDKNNYYEMLNGSRKYAWEFKRTPPPKTLKETMSALQPSTDFEIIKTDEEDEAPF